MNDVHPNTNIGDYDSYFNNLFENQNTSFKKNKNGYELPVVYIFLGFKIILSSI